MTDIDTWEATGSRLATEHGTVFVLDLPAVDDRGLDPILVLHGFPTSSYDWRHVLDALRAHRRVVLFDFLGFGLSDKPDRRYSLELQADIAEAVARHAGLERVDLVTHDMGNSVGGEVLARDLDGTLAFTIGRRVLTNGSIYVEMARLTAGQELLLSLDDARIDLGDDGTAYKGGLAGTFSPHHPPDPAELDDQWRLMARDRGDALLPRTIRYIEDRRAREERYTGAIERHPAPLGVVWGRLDPVAVHPMAERLLAARTDAELVTLDDVGHWPMIEAPDRLVEAMLHFLDAD